MCVSVCVYIVFKCVYLFFILFFYIKAIPNFDGIFMS